MSLSPAPRRRGREARRPSWSSGSEGRFPCPDIRCRIFFCGVGPQRSGPPPYMGALPQGGPGSEGAPPAAAAAAAGPPRGPREELRGRGGAGASFLFKLCARAEWPRPSSLERGCRGGRTPPRHHDRPSGGSLPLTPNVRSWGHQPYGEPLSSTPNVRHWRSHRLRSEMARRAMRTRTRWSQGLL